MSEPRDFAIPLSGDEVEKILSICSPEGLLVGGQALAFWADHLEVALPLDLASGVTADIDFIGDSKLAHELGRKLGWNVWVPTLDDATPQTGKVTARMPGGGVKQVDFLSGVVGLTTKDIERRAAELDIEGLGRLRVMHPVDVLDSRIQNLELLREKRDAAGLAQARLAVAVVREFIKREIAQSDERTGLKWVERVADIARDTAAVRVFLRHGIDPLEAVPVDAFRLTPTFQTRRWQQIESEVRQKRESLRSPMSRGPVTSS